MEWYTNSKEVHKFVNNGKQTNTNYISLTINKHVLFTENKSKLCIVNENFI